MSRKKNRYGSMEENGDPDESNFRTVMGIYIMRVNEKKCNV